MCCCVSDILFYKEESFRMPVAHGDVSMNAVIEERSVMMPIYFSAMACLCGFYLYSILALTCCAFSMCSLYARTVCWQC